MSKIQNETLQIFIGIFIWTLSFPVLLPLLVFLSSWKFPTNVSDTMYSVTELANTISYAFLGDGIIDIDKLRRHFYNTFIEDGKDKQYPLFHHTFTTILGFGYKIRAPLDLERHIFQEDFHPGQETENEALHRIAKDNSRISGNRPKWEMILLQNRVQGKSTLIWKFSHGLVDAYSVRTLMDIFTDNHATYRIPELAKRKGTMFWVKLFARVPALMMQTYIIRPPYNFWTHPFLVQPDVEQNTVPKPSNVFSERYWSKASLEFSKISEISKRSGCRIGCVCVSLYISTLRRTLMERGKWDEARDAPILYKLPAPNHPADFGRFCNHATPGIVNIPLKINNKITQLKMISERMEHYEKSDVGLGNLLLELLLSPILPKFVIDSFIYWLSGIAFVFIVNPFIFSSEKYKILGVGVTNMFFLTHTEPPFNLKAVTFTPLTILANQMSFSVVGSEDIFESQKDAELFTTNFLDEVKCLQRDVEKWVSKGGNGGSGKNKKVQFQCA